MSLLMAAAGALAVNRQHVAARVGAIKEAENVARTLAVLLSDSNGFAASAQTAISKLHQAQNRDVVLVDTNQLILADAVPAGAGKIYRDDPNHEIAATLADAQARTFVQRNAGSSLPIQQIVVPVQNPAGHVVGAVILEYTPLYDELMRSTRSIMREIVVTGLGGIAIVLLSAFYMGRSIARPLHHLTLVAARFASGQTDLPLPAGRKDEIGELAHAFQNMVQKRRHAEEELRQARDQFESRVIERTAELAKANQALLVENAERKRGERQLSVEYALSRILAQSGTLEQATPKIIQVVCETLGWDAGELWLIDHRAGLLRCAEIWSVPDLELDEFKTRTREMTLPRGIGLPGRVWASGRPTWLPDVTQEGNFPRVSIIGKTPLRSAFAFPVLIGSGVGGVFGFFSRKLCVSDEGLQRTFINLGGQLGQFFERKRVEGHLFQSQKMETVGKLAGGIAHEFNSIMTAIIGQSELLLNDLSPENPLCENVTEIRKAADRAATLTRQLLAFGRKQILQPEILDLNVVLAGMESMLLHLMGKSMDVRIIFAVGLKAVRADASQIEQVVVNIVMNASDAMPNGGKLILETANVSLGAEYVSHFPELKAGEYVMLAITDTGAGMSDEVKARIFEPFFTTKAVGQGTGLGLATCHGIVQQSGGHIAVYSESGRGATFKIYLPQVEQKVKVSVPPRPSVVLPHGTETILLVEDDPALRTMAATLLAAC